MALKFSKPRKRMDFSESLTASKGGPAQAVVGCTSRLAELLRGSYCGVSDGVSNKTRKAEDLFPTVRSG